MITSIARQSVIIKCLRQKSILVSNYELYYLAGLMTRCFGITCNKDMKPGELLDTILRQTDTMEPKDEKEAYLLKLVSVYRPLEDYDEQMGALFEWGASEQDLWQVNTSRRS